VHFGAFAGEAVSSEGFPVRGTLFSAFFRSRGPLFVFFLALWSPFCASIALALVSRKWSLVPYTVLIGCAVLFAYLTLQRKGFFNALNPLPIQVRKDLEEQQNLMSDAPVPNSKG
jgi:hypothetical protein